jgi:apolipoprotein D and lipocalin family protein
MRNALFILMAMLAMSACTRHPPIHTVEQVDLQRFMGDWYIIANIPTFLEEGAHNAVESYRLDEDGTIATTFRFRDGSFDGALQSYHPVGYVLDGSNNAVWDMQFIWPLKAEYRVIWLDPEYEVTVIGRTKRDYVWIMARKPTISASRYAQILQFLEQQGYDTGQVRKVPQRWPQTA